MYAITHCMEARPMTKLLILILFFPLSILGQDMRNSIGVLTIADNYEKTDHKIEFVNDDGTPWYTLDLYKELKAKNDFMIIAFKPDYFLFHIRCQKQTPTGFAVVVNEESGLTKFVLNSSTVRLQSWEEYVLNVFSVDFDPNKIPIYNKVSGTSIKSNPKKESIIVPKEVRGEWMKIIWLDSGEYPSNNTSVKTGWIKWKKDNKILITLYHLS